MSAIARALLFPFIILSCPLFAQVSQLTQHNNLKRTGWNDQEISLNHSNVNIDSFGLISSFPVDDQIYAQPLLLSKLSIGNFTGQVVFVATVNNTLYAFNADDPSQPAPLWQLNLNPAGERSPNIYDLVDPVYGKPCDGNYLDFSGRF